MKKIATLFGIGYLRMAPGTAGSLAAALLAYAMLQVSQGWIVLAIGTIAACLIGTVAAERYMQTNPGDHDPSAIVIDELAGQWITYMVWYLWIVGITAQDISREMLEIDAAPQFLAIGFILFRFFDILKPWPISWADRKIKGGFGVMFDDVLAGFAAGCVLYGVYLFWPLFFGQLEEMP